MYTTQIYRLGVDPAKIVAAAQGRCQKKGKGNGSGSWNSKSGTARDRQEVSEVQQNIVSSNVPF